MTGLNTKTQAILDDLPSLLADTNTKLDTIHDDNVLVIAGLTSLAGSLSDMYIAMVGLSTGLAANLPFNATDGGLFNLINNMAGQNEGMLDRLQAIQDALTLTDQPLISQLEAMQLVEESTSVNTLRIGRQQQTLIICCNDNPALPPPPAEQQYPDNLCQRAGWLADFIYGAITGIQYLLDNGTINTTLVGLALNQYGAQFTPDVVYSSVSITGVMNAIVEGVAGGSGSYWQGLSESVRLGVGVSTDAQNAFTEYQAAIDASSAPNSLKGMYKALAPIELFTYLFTPQFDNNLNGYSTDCGQLTYSDPTEVSTGSNRTYVWDTQNEVQVYTPGVWRIDWSLVEGGTNEEPGTGYLAFHLYDPPNNYVPADAFLIQDCYQWQVKCESDVYGAQLYLDGMYFSEITTEWQSIPGHTSYIEVKDGQDNGTTKPSWQIQIRTPV